MVQEGGRVLCSTSGQAHPGGGCSRRGGLRAFIGETRWNYKNINKNNNNYSHKCMHCLGQVA